MKLMKPMREAESGYWQLLRAVVGIAGVIILSALLTVGLNA